MPSNIPLSCISCLFIIVCSSSLSAKTVNYTFDIDYEMVDFTGSPVEGMTINYQIPGPTIEASVGDILQVTFNNKMNVESSIHWHGVLLPNDQDGVPYLTTPPIPAGKSFTYEYPITHAGTYWYHSHSGLQEQRGVYGPLRFFPAQETVYADYDYIAVLSDWTDEAPEQVIANIKKDGDYYALKKGSVQSWDKVIKHGSEAIQRRLQGAWTRMGPMDLSDVGYDAFLLNGQALSHFPEPQAGETIRLRLINAGASTYFLLQFAGGPMTIVAADGIDTEPLSVNKLRISIAETYDVLITVPEDGAYEFRASSEDGTGHAGLIIGQGEVQEAATIPKPNLFLVDHSMHEMPEMESMHDMHAMHHAAPEEPLAMLQEYMGVRATAPTAFKEEYPVRQVHLNLTGNMERYVWSFNNRTFREAEAIKIHQGEVVQFVLENKTMMHHPLHLHGHFFRVLNGEGEFSPLMHTVNVPPMDSITIEFLANEEKDWFFHCHNLYHMKSGMARVVSYAGSSRLTQATLNKLGHDSWYPKGELSLQSNMLNGSLTLSNSRDLVEVEFDYGYEKSYELGVTYERNLSRFTDVYSGIEFEREDDGDRSQTGIIGLHYVLPMLIETDFRYDTANHVRTEFSSNLQLSPRTKFQWRWNTDDEYRHLLGYEHSKQLLFSVNWDSDYHLGAGLTWRL